MSSNSVYPPVFSSTDSTSGTFFDNLVIEGHWDIDQGNVANNHVEEEEDEEDKEESAAAAVTAKKRERNRVLARETRQRKKFFVESLQKEVQDLVKENVHLKSLAHTLEPSIASTIIQECCTELPSVVAAVANEATAILARADFSLISAICSAQRSFCITDPALPDNPIVFASQDFLNLTGYGMDEILGRNCRFLQGPETDLAGMAVLRKGISEGIDTSVTLLNYKKNGTTYWNQIYISALRDVDDNIVNYVGVQIEVFPLQVQIEESDSVSDKAMKKIKS